MILPRGWTRRIENQRLTAVLATPGARPADNRYGWPELAYYDGFLEYGHWIGTTMLFRPELRYEH